MFFSYMMSVVVCEVVIECLWGLYWFVWFVVSTIDLARAMLMVYARQLVLRGADELQSLSETDVLIHWFLKEGMDITI